MALSVRVRNVVYRRMSGSARPSDKGGPRPENQRKRTEIRGPRRSLIGLLAVAAVGTITLGIMLIGRPGGGVAYLSPSLLAQSPLTSFRGLGLELVILVGGTQALAASLLVLRHERARFVATVAAAIVVATSAILVMLSIGLSWLQPTLFGIGFIELLLVAASTPRKPADRKHRFGRR